ncbi:hypothetical protein Patl1_23735 [Pistacia atlantica]|uniref:Uncharacterized protein n=1 Tax=Pistacia atlantica TaxID=434234 RepID=A0ACC1A0M9_9ROSI|nr:hypothetical protein Patl1_23735 [Pistacia atlantica]
MLVWDRTRVYLTSNKCEVAFGLACWRLSRSSDSHANDEWMIGMMTRHPRGQDSLDASYSKVALYWLARSKPGVEPCGSGEGLSSMVTRVEGTA